MAVGERNAFCVESRKGSRSGPVAFSAKAFTIGDYTLASTAPHKLEMVVAGDKDGGTFSCSVGDLAGNLATITIRADNRFVGASLHRPDGSTLSCGPQSH